MSSPSLDTIKKKMAQMKNDKDMAIQRAEENEQRAIELEDAIRVAENEHNGLLKNITSLDLTVDTAAEQLTETTVKLEEANKNTANSELEISALQRRIYLITEDLAKTQERLKVMCEQFTDKSKLADESEKARGKFESLGFENDEKMSVLEKQVSEALAVAADADKRFDETNRRLAIMEVDLERAEDRAEIAETKTLELEEELKVVGNNMKILEASEQEAIQREESYAEQIKECTTRLKEAEQRAETGERTMAKLQAEVDRLEEELQEGKDKYKDMSDELEQTLNDLQATA
jgi:chromosome segregation ATPase